jgi:aminoglycoside/choline kinase family phosphotransferase
VDEIEAKARAWAAEAVGRAWPGAAARQIVKIKGDASGRRFYRIVIDRGTARAPETAVAVDLGPDDLPLYARALQLLSEPLAEPPWINSHRLFAAFGANVPELYLADCARRMLLVEDVGATSLFDAARANPALAPELYRAAMDQLLRIHVDGTRALSADSFAARVAYDERLFRWEMEQFVEFGLAQCDRPIDRARLGAELEQLAARLGRLPRVLSHRDYHGWNLFVQGDNGRIRVIDFQDALLAPAAQDLAVLLTTRNTHEVVTPSLERRLLDYYLAGVARRGATAPSPADFHLSYRLCVLQHGLKVIGRFGYLEREGVRGYAKFIPDAAAQARRMLASGLESEFPAIAESLTGAVMSETKA